MCRLVGQICDRGLVKVTQSSKLADVCYDIRGPVLDAARQLEEEGRRILKLNIGNPAPFGFEAPDEIIANVVRNLPFSEGYSDSQGLLSARTAIVQHYQEQGFVDVSVEHVWLGNGVSELISFSLQALLDDGDEVLIPAPDYPLWTAATSLCGGRAVHYMCDESADWLPDVDDLAAKISARTKAIVLINPNNPTGAVYPRWVLESIAELAREHGLVVMTDEIYEKILYDGAEHIPFASVAPDLLTLTFNGLSKAYRLAGFRSAWLLVTGPRPRGWQLSRGPVNPGQHAVVPQRARATRDPDRAWAAARVFTTSCCPVAGCASNVTPRWPHSSRYPVSRACSRVARCTCSRAWIPRSIRSRTISNSCLTCCATNTCSSCKVVASIGRNRITCASSRSREPMT